MGFFKNTKLPVAEYLSRNGLYLPTGLSITYLQQKFVIDKIKKIVVIIVLICKITFILR